MLCDFEMKMLKTEKLKRKQWLKSVGFMILLLESCFIFGQNVDAKKIIVIDPGHGGKDSGAIGKNGAMEKEVVLNIAKSILELNDKSNSDLEIYLTRYTDTLIALPSRCNLARVLQADFFISLHCNHSDNTNARGVEVYVGSSKSKFLRESIWLAFRLHADLNQKLGFKSRGVKLANFQVLRGTMDFMPSTLLEIGFLSNEEESEFIKKMSANSTIASVVLEYLIKI